MSKRNFRKGPQEGQAPRPQGAPQPGRPPQQGGQHGQAHGQRPGQAQQGKGPGWVQTRDSVRRDLEVALQSLSFLERFGEGLDSQRRLFIDFPRVTEELRSGAMERLAIAMEHLYEGGQGALDLNRFLRDLPLALGHLAAAEFAAHRQKQQQAAARLARESGAVVAAPDASKSEAHASEESAKAESSGAGEPAHAEAASEEHAGAVEESGEGAHAETAHAGEAHAEVAAPHEAAATTPEAAAPAIASESTEAGASPGESSTSGASPGESSTSGASPGEPAASSASPGEPAASDAPAGKTGAAAPAPDAASAAMPEPVSPRVELRTRLLAAAPQLSKAAQSYRRNTATVRRAASPRRALGPWRSDREVLDQARRAVEFGSKIYDAYAEAWNDAPLAKGQGTEMAAEMDRFLAWTQLSRYAEVALTQSTPGQRPHEAAPGVRTDKAPSAPPPAAPESTHEAHLAEAAQAASAGGQPSAAPGEA